MEILDDKEKTFILKQSEHYLPDRQKYENNLIFLSALRIINIVLGKEWYNKSSTGFVDERGLRQIDTQKQHPISKLLSNGEPNSIVRLVMFANYIQNLYDGPDFIEKIRKYVKDEKRTEITFNKFLSTSFELRMACLHKQNSLKIEFVRESNIPSPDLKIVGKNGFAFLECKKKRPRDDFSLSSILNTIKKTNDEQIYPRKAAGIIAIDLSLKETIYGSYKDEISNSIQILLKDMPLVNFVEIYNEYVRFEGAKSTHGISRQVIENPNPKQELSNDIIEVIYHPKKIPNKLPFSISL